MTFLLYFPQLLYLFTSLLMERGQGAGMHMWLWIYFVMVKVTGSCIINHGTVVYHSVCFWLASTPEYVFSRISSIFCLFFLKISFTFAEWKTERERERELCYCCSHCHMKILNNFYCHLSFDNYSFIHFFCFFFFFEK